MGFVSFKKFHFILIIILFSICYIEVNAFRLIQTSHQHEPKKVITETKQQKEPVKKIDLIKEELLSRAQKLKNDTIKFHLKTPIKPIHTHDIPIVEKKIKPVQPSLLKNMTKEHFISHLKETKSLLAKEAKVDDEVKQTEKSATQKITVKTSESIKTREPVKKEEPTIKEESLKADNKLAETKVEPIKEKKVPAEQKIESIKEKKVPAEKKVEPVKEKKVPAEKKVEPVKEKKIPAEKKVEPVKEKKVPLMDVKLKPEPDKLEKVSKLKEPKLPSPKNKTTSATKTSGKSPKTLSNVTTTLYYSLPTFSPNFQLAISDECKKQGHILLDELNKYKLWALKMYDSTAKIPSGILRGNLNQFGDYDQCVGIFVKIPNGNKKEPDVKIAGKYCLANIDFQAEIQDMKLPVHLAQGRAMIRSKNQDPGHFIPRFTTIRWGICIPSGCTANDAEQILEESIKIYNESKVIGLNFDVSIDSSQCHIRKPPKKLWDYDYNTLLIIFFCTTIITFVFVATLRDIRLSEPTENEVVAEVHETSTIEKVLMSFSLKRTVTALLSHKSDPDEIECIYGVRTICTFVLYLAHKLIPIGHLPFTNKTTLTEISNNPFSILLRLSVIYTDTFLLLSGVLTAYRMSKDIEEKGHIPWFNRFVARFIRLTPSLLFVLLYYAYIMELTGEGPLWNTVITPNAKLCKEYWWRNILYIQNVYPFEEMCATQTHQLALDMQLSLIAPILVWLLYRRPLMGVFTTILLHSISVILRYYTTLNYRLSLVIYHGISISQLYRTANLLYASSLHRATPYLAGIGLGVLLRQIKPNFYMPKILTILGWIVAGYFTTWTLYTPSHLANRTYQYDIHEAAQFSALCSLAWSLALSWLIFASFADREGYINVFLSSRPMVLLSRISYTLYLTQFIVFFYNVGTAKTTKEFKVNNSIEIPEILNVIISATLLTILVDMPVQKIKTVLLNSVPVTDSSDLVSEVSSEHEHIQNNTRKLSEDSQKAVSDEELEIINKET